MNGKAIEMIVKSGLESALISADREANRGVFHAGLGACISKARAVAMQLNKPRTARVAHLIFLCRPSAIVFRVAKAVVYSIKGVLQRRTRPHVLQEITKVSPRRINRDPSPAVMLVTKMIRVSCSVDHALPTHVFRAAPRSSCMPVLLHRVINKASTRFDVAVPKSCRESLRCLAALTFTYPLRISRLNGSTIDHGQSSEHLAGQIKCTVTKRFNIPTSARFGMPAFQLGAIYNRCCSALAQAFPVRSPFFNMPALDDCQFVESPTSEINKCHNVPRYHARLTPSSMATI